MDATEPTIAALTLVRGNNSSRTERARTRAWLTKVSGYFTVETPTMHRLDRSSKLYNTPAEAFMEIVMGFFSDVLETVIDAAFDFVDVVTENPVASVAVVAVTVATGGVAAAAAPAVGAAVSAAGFGVAGGTLSGAAASSAGLAALGGGSLAAGGAGMAGGTAVVTATGAALGAGTSAAVTSAVSEA